MALLAMRDEILVLILSRHSKVRGHLYRAALVDRRLAILNCPILPRSIYFLFDDKRKGGLERCQQYLRGCFERPELGQKTSNAHVVEHKTSQRMLRPSQYLNIPTFLDSLVMR